MGNLINEMQQLIIFIFKNIKLYFGSKRSS